jgi:hypothetical protein
LEIASSDSLSEPTVLAQDIAEEPQATHQLFNSIYVSLGNGKKVL